MRDGALDRREPPRGALNFFRPWPIDGEMTVWYPTREGVRACGALDQGTGKIVDDDRDGLISRRRLLRTGAIAAAGMALPGASAFAATKRPAFASAKTASPAPALVRTGYARSRFAPHVGTQVKLRPPGSATMVRALLVAIEDVPNVASLAGAEDAYTLRFRGPASPLLAEGVVGIRHPRFGTLALYLTPAPADGPFQDYLAVINRHIPRSARRAARSQRR